MSSHLSPSPSRKSLLRKNYHHEFVPPALVHGKKTEKHHVGPIMRKYVVDAARRARDRKLKELVGKKYPRDVVESVLANERFLQRRIVTSTTRIAAKVALDAFGIKDAALRKRVVDWLLAQRTQLELFPKRAESLGVPFEQKMVDALSRVHVNADRDFMPLFMRVYNICIADVEDSGNAAPRKGRLS